MVTASRSSTFQRNLLLSIGGVFLLFAICFCIYQYQREKEYKIDILHSRLQMYNYDIMQVLGEDGITSRHQFLGYVRQHPLKGLRVSVIDRQGRVLLDSNEPHPDSLDNHLGRTEIQQALRDGNGFDLKRTSQSTHETYFYSATRFKRVIVRTAVPYSAELTQSLRADNTYIFFSIALTLLLGSVLYISTRRISRHIGYLREFAIKAENGEPLDHELERNLPDDELGDISHTIIMLYWKLRHAEEDKARLKRQLTQDADLVCCMDFNTLSRSSEEIEQVLLQANTPLLLIDHHPSPSIPARLTLSYPAMSSTAEIVFRLIWQLGGYECMTRNMATAIYCGMMTDTGGFTFNSSRSEIFFIISQLIAKGIDKDKIYRNIYHVFSIDRLRLTGYVLFQKMKVLTPLRASYYTISREEQKRFHFIKGDAEGLVNLPLQIKGHRLSISMREDTEKDNLIWISLRSVDDFPCNKMAEEFFNGGGHKNASGGKLFCSLDEAEKIARKAIQAYAKML